MELKLILMDKSIKKPSSFSLSCYSLYNTLMLKFFLKLSEISISLSISYASCNPKQLIEK